MEPGFRWEPTGDGWRGMRQDLAGDVIDVSQSGADLYAIWKRTKTEPAPVSTLPQTGSVIGLIGGLVAAVLLTGAGIAFKRRG